MFSSFTAHFASLVPIPSPSPHPHRWVLGALQLETWLTRVSPWGLWGRAAVTRRRRRLQQQSSVVSVWRLGGRGHGVAGGFPQGCRGRVCCRPHPWLGGGHLLPMSPQCISVSASSRLIGTSVLLDDGPPQWPHNLPRDSVPATVRAPREITP